MQRILDARAVFQLLQIQIDRLRIMRDPAQRVRMRADDDLRAPLRIDDRQVNRRTAFDVNALMMDGGRFAIRRPARGIASGSAGLRCSSIRSM